MPFVTENVESRELTVEAGKRGTDLRFDIVEAADEAVAELALLDVLPALLPNGQRLQSYRLSTQGAGIWTATASYKSGSDGAESGGGSGGGGSSGGSGAAVTFDTSGGTIRLTQSLGTVAAYVPADVSAGAASTTLLDGVTAGSGEIQVVSSAGFPSVPYRVSVGGELMRVTAVTGDAWTVERSRATSAAHPAGTAVTFSKAPDYHEAVNATLEGVEGVDVTVPTFAFSETYTFPVATVNARYREALFTLTGKMNAATFRGLKRGECLFLGASGSRRGYDDVEITFKFAGSANRANFKAGSIAVEEKLGWDYLWVRYSDRSDSAAGYLVKRPVAVFVERVYEFGNFDLLGI